MNTLYILVGIPGCGKTSLIKAQAKEEHIVLSSDELRVELYGFEDQTHNGEVFQEMNKRTKDAGKEGKTVWYDATNINRKRRVALAKEMKKYFDRIEIVACYCSVNELLWRNETRPERRLPVEKLHQIIKSYQAPTVHEYPYDEVSYIYTGTENGFICPDVDLAVQAMRYMTYDQNNKYHTETLGEHTLTVYNACNGNPNIQIAAFWHDMGKPFCRVEDEDGESHYYGHAAVSAYMYINQMVKTGRPVSTYILLLIEWHDHIFNFNHDVEQMKKAYNAKYDLTDDFWEAMEILTKADRLRGEDSV